MKLEILQKIYEAGYTFFAPPDHLYARVPLETRLSLDTEAGHLIINRVSTVWLHVTDPTAKAQPGSAALCDTERAHLYLYEALVVNKEDFNFDPRNPNYIYIMLSKSLVSHFALKADQQIQVELQFQLMRRWFVELRYALDQLQSPDIFFPNTMVQFNVELMQKIHELKFKYPKVEYAFVMPWSLDGY